MKLAHKDVSAGGIWGASTRARQAQRLVSPVTPVVLSPETLINRNSVARVDELSTTFGDLTVAGVDELCFQDTLYQASVKKCIVECLSGSSSGGGTRDISTRPYRGHWYKVTPRDGESFILFGTAHFCPYFYENFLKDQFLELIQETGVKKVYYELSQKVQGLKVFMEHEIHESLSGLDLQFGALETSALRDDLAEELGWKEPYTEHLTKLMSNPEFVNKAKPIWRLVCEAYYSGSQQLLQLVMSMNWLIPLPSHSLLEGYDDLGHMIQRNLQWMKTIRTNQIPSAYCFGVAHLYGEHGLIQLCLAEGFCSDCLSRY